MNILQIYAANKVDGSINWLVNVTTKLRLVNVVKMRAHTDSNENQMKLYKRKRVDAVEKKSIVLRACLVDSIIICGWIALWCYAHDEPCGFQHMPIYIIFAPTTLMICYVCPHPYRQRDVIDEKISAICSNWKLIFSTIVSSPMSNEWTVLSYRSQLYNINVRLQQLFYKLLSHVCVSMRWKFIELESSSIPFQSLAFLLLASDLYSRMHKMIHGYALYHHNTFTWLTKTGYANQVFNKNFYRFEIWIFFAYRHYLRPKWWFWHLVYRSCVPNVLQPHQHHP